MISLYSPINYKRPIPDIPKSLSLTFNKHFLKSNQLMIILIDNQNLFFSFVFFSKKKTTHIEMRETHTTEKKERKKKEEKRENLKRDINNGLILFFLSNTHSEYR
jgi:hypothetical protein